MAENYQHSLKSKPEYLQAMGLVAVELNSLEVVFAELFGAILRITTEAAKAIYFVPNGLSVRLGMLEGATEALSDNPVLQREVGSLVGRGKKIMTRRNDMTHHLWAVHPETMSVHRNVPKQGIDYRSEPISLVDLTDISRDILNAYDAAIAVSFKVRYLRGVSFPLPNTRDELAEWLAKNQPPPDFQEQRKLQAPPQS